MGKLIGVFENNSEAWHQARHGCLGGSQVGAAIGVSPWESAVTCFYKVTGQIPVVVPESDAMVLGKLLEKPLVDMFRYKHPDFVVDDMPGTWVHDNEVRFLANPDGIYTKPDGTRGILEIKTSSDFWSEPPLHYVAQVYWYMWILGLREAIIAGHIGGRYQEHVIVWDDFLWDVWHEQVMKFWDSVTALKQPEWDGSESTYKTMRDLNRDIVDEGVELGEIGEALVVVDAAYRRASENLNYVRSQALFEMRNAKTGLLNGEPICYRQNTSSGSPYLKMRKVK